MGSLRRFERAWIAHGFLREVVLIYPVYAIMMGDNGVSPLQLSILFVAWSGSVLLFEVPSGTLADRMSRKRLIVVSGIIKAGAFLLWLLVPSFWGYLLGFVVWGSGSTLRSGTSESFLHDTLAEHGAAARFEKIYGRGEAAAKAGTALAFISGGMLSELGFTWPLALSGLGPLAGSLLAGLLFRDPPRSGIEEPEPDEGYFETMAAGFREARGKPAILALIGLAASVLTVAGVLDEYVGPFLNDKGTLSLTAIGVAYAGMALVSLLGVGLAHRLAFLTIARVSRFLIVGSALLLSAVWLPGLAAAGAIVVFIGMAATAEILVAARLQRSIEGHARATITSMSGMVREIAGILLYLTVGLGAELAGWSYGILALALFSIGSSVYFARRREVD